MINTKNNNCKQKKVFYENCRMREIRTFIWLNIANFVEGVIMRLVNVEDVKVDMELARPVYMEGRILLNKGIENLQPYQKRLKQHGINYVYVNDKKSKGIEINDIIKQETRLQGEQVIRDTLNDILLNKKIKADRVKNIVDKIIDDVLKTGDINVNLIEIKSYDAYTFEHSVNVAVLSILIARSLQYNKKKIRKLGVGAILHDVGKILIPEEIIKKPDSLSDEEFDVVKEHTRLGYDSLKDNKLISPLSRTVILSHHERINGSGYPRGLKKNEIHDFGKITAIADVFDALTSDRVYRSKWPVFKVVDFLTSKAGSLFKREYIRKFISNIAIYPNGTQVILSNGCKAIVKKQNPHAPTRPVIRIIENEKGQEMMEEIDLMEHLNIVIKDVC